MTIKELIDKIKELSASDDSELRIMLAGEDYGVAAIDMLDGEDGNTKLVLASDDELKDKIYRVSFTITRDNRTYSYGTIRRTAASDEEVILDMEKIKDSIMKDAGFEGEIAENTGSVIIEEDDEKLVTGKGGKVRLETGKVKHYYNCVVLEILREIDSDNDVYARIWKNGRTL